VESESSLRLLKGQEVAHYLNISRALAYRLMQRGEIKIVKFGKSVRVAENDLRDFVETHKQIEES
jgi:excisionase family DNA binding protein